MKKIVIIGPFPPPVHGMAKNLKIVADILNKNSDVSRISISPGSIIRGTHYHLTKIAKVIYGLSRLLFIGLSSRNTSLYMPPDAGLGMYYSLLFATFGRILGMKIFFHHRSFAYINKYNNIMNKIVNIAGTDATHIFLCKKMESNYRKLYTLNFSSMIVSNAQHVNVIKPDAIKPLNECFVIGHLSNLGLEKGLVDAIELVDKLIKENLNIKLLLAGPTENSEAETILNSAIKRLGNHIEYRGYVEDNEKHKFFSDIDLFLFPTRYKNEAQPNVIFEANAYATPVITLERGCISSDVNEQNGVVLDPKKNFSTQAFPIIKTWLLYPHNFMKLKQTSLNKAKNTSANAQQGFISMIKEIEK